MKASILSEEIPLLIGKSVKDELSNEIGTILSFMVDLNEQVSEVLIKDIGGEFKRHSVDRLIVDNDALILLSEIDKTVKTVSEKIPLLWQKKKALEKLLHESKLLPEIYENLRREFSEALEKLKFDAQGAIDELNVQIRCCEETFKMLNLAKTYLEVEHEIGRVKEAAYRGSLHTILNGLKSLFEKKQSLQKKREILSNILLGEGFSIKISQRK